MIIDRYPEPSVSIITFGKLSLGPHYNIQKSGCELHSWGRSGWLDVYKVSVF